MKKSFFLLFITLIVLILSIVVLIPTLNVNIFGRNFYFEGINFGKFCSASQIDENGQCINPFNYINTRAFKPQEKIIFEFVDLNTSEASEEEKNKIFSENIDIAKQRARLMELSDYRIQEYVDSNGKYFLEVYIPKEESEDKTFQSLFASLFAQGSLSIYEDDPNYVLPEGEDIENQSFDFLQGKKRSDVLSIDQIKRISDPYFDPRIGNETGGFVVRVDFGEENRDNVMLSASGTYNSTNSLIPGIQFVQSGIPFGIQAVGIPPVQPGYKGQSYVIFTVLGENMNHMRVKALYSILSTQPISTSIQITTSQYLDPIFETNDIQILKIIIPLSLVLFTSFVLITKRKKGIIFASTVASTLIIGFSLGQLGLFQTMLNEGIILGSMLGVFFIALNTLWVLEVDAKNWDMAFTKSRKIYWGMLIAFILGMVVFATLGISNIFLGVSYGFLLFLAAGVFSFELVLSTIASYILQK